MQTTKTRPQRQSGFSLIELIVVITIIGILATTVVINVTGQTDKAKVSTATSDIKTLETACEMFYLAIGRYPDSLEELINPPDEADGTKSKKYIKKTPKDPWSHEIYQYELTDEGPYILSYGADKSDGGDGINKDIHNRGDE